MSNFLYNGKIVTVDGKIISNQSSTPTPGGTWEGDVRMTVADGRFGPHAPGIYTLSVSDPNVTLHSYGYWTFYKSSSSYAVGGWLSANIGLKGNPTSDNVIINSFFSGTSGTAVSGSVTLSTSAPRSSQGSENKLSVTTFTQYTLNSGTSVTLEQILV
jgi:hypothetical protein